MNEPDLRSILARGESMTVEFKSDRGHLANTQSGLPLIFVSISKLCMNSTMPHVSIPPRGST